MFGNLHFSGVVGSKIKIEVNHKKVSKTRPVNCCTDETKRDKWKASIVQSDCSEQDSTVVPDFAFLLILSLTESCGGVPSPNPAMRRKRRFPQLRFSENVKRYRRFSPAELKKFNSPMTRKRFSQCLHSERSFTKTKGGQAPCPAKNTAPRTAAMLSKPGSTMTSTISFKPNARPTTSASPK